MEEEVAREIAKSVEFAEAGRWEPVEDLTRFVYSEAPLPLSSPSLGED
jgi:TPP-dependent pyruvate/acetoin dehydrogenase alpha subunit